MYWLLWFVVSIIFFAIALKVYIKLNTRWNGSYTCLIGKTALVTGANSGMGYFTALDFAKRGARVIIACRNEEKARRAVSEMTKASSNPNVIYKLMDLTSLESVRRLASDINENEDRLDILVNNAGTILEDEGFTKDGVQSILQVNHISQFLLTHLLIDKLKRSSPSRIVNVTSFIARKSSLSVETLNTVTRSYFSSSMYENSKLCNILFTIELARRLKAENVTVNVAHPGVAHSEIFRNLDGFTKFLIYKIGKWYLWTPEEGAQSQIHLAVSADVADQTGCFYANCRKIGLYRNARNADLARGIWRKSEELARLTDSEKISN